MTHLDYGSFIVNILSVLEKNGYPEKKVSLPLEKMYASAYDKGLNFNKVLEFLAEKGTLHEKTSEKIIFFAKVAEESDAESAPTNVADLMAQAKTMMQQMKPEEIRRLQELFINMNDEQKDAIMQQAKTLGLI